MASFSATARQAASSLSSSDKTKATTIRLFQKSLKDMITGIRANKDAQREFINKCLSDIRAEVVSSDISNPFPRVVIGKVRIFFSIDEWSKFQRTDLKLI